MDRQTDGQTDKQTGRQTNKQADRLPVTAGVVAAAMEMKFSQSAMDESFLLSNISPQHPTLNRVYWERMERYCRELTKTFPNVWAVSGPLFLPSRQRKDWFVNYKVIGENQVADACRVM